MKRQRKDKTQQLRILSQSVVLEEARTPYMIRTTILIICFSFAAFITWSAITRINEMARTSGEIIPSEYVQAVQHFEGGIIDKIFVRDDDLVKKGQVLIQLKGDNVQSDYEQVTSRLTLLKLQIARLHSFLSGDLTEFNRISKKYPDISAAQHDILKSMLASQIREQGVLQQQLVQKEKQEALLQRELASQIREHGVLQQQLIQKQKQEALLQRELITAQKGLKIAKTAFETQKELYEERLVSETTYFAVLRDMNEQQGKVDTLQIRIQQARNAIHEYEWRLQSIDSDSRDKALQQLETLEGEQAETVELAKKLHKQVNRLTIRSPVDGVVKGLEFHTIGGVIASGHKLMEIVPADKKIFAEVKISPNDIGHIKPGMPVIIKVTSYDSSRYGHIDGKVTSLSATTFTSERGGTYYKGVITLDKNYVGSIPGQNHVLPGMIIHGDIITVQKSLLDYLLKPIHKALNSSFSER